MNSDGKSRVSIKTTRGREAREAATDLFAKKMIADTRSLEIAKMARLRALRLAKDAAGKAD